VRDLILDLHQARKHEHVIAAIEAALVNGQSQPWMYEVLALSMEIAGRPKEDVERVLLSGLDFTGADFESTMYSAAYLTRFERPAVSLRLYRQASRLAPTRPEPYVLGLKLAQRLKDYDAVKWAAVGILTYAWTDDYKQLHRDAENAALETEQLLRKAGRDDEAEALEQAVAEAQQRDLILKLTWSGNGDVDLIVEEPPGTICSCELPQSPGGGVLAHDGYGPDQKHCHEEYVCAFGVPGNYRVKVRHVWGNVVGKRAQLTVARYVGTPQESSRTFTVALDKQDKIVRVSLPRGRRTELARVTPAVPRLKPRRTSRKSVLQMLGYSSSGDSRRGTRSLGAAHQPGVAMHPGQARPAVGYTPIITTLSEGVTMSAMAVISADRRYVRITAIPSFSNITDVFTFSFINGGGGGGGGGTGGGGSAVGGRN